MALFTRFCKAKPPYTETADQVPDPPLTSSADCYALALVGNSESRSETRWSGRGKLDRMRKEEVVTHGGVLVATHFECGLVDLRLIL